VTTVAFGKYRSPNYETAQRFIPAIRTGSGIPQVQGTNEIFFNLVLPAGPKPPRVGRSRSTAMALRTTRTIAPPLSRLPLAAHAGAARSRTLSGGRSHEGRGAREGQTQ
jgi:hypothetical protein